MYKVIGATKSRAMRVLWALEEIGTPYEHIPAAPRSEEAIRYNPNGKIPALVDGDAVLTDSMAILTYLADKHGKLAPPAGTPERAKQDALTFWLIDEFDAVLWTAAKHKFVLPPEMREPAIIDPIKAEFTINAQKLSDQLDGPFLIGDTLTIPDILACHCLNWAIGAGFPRVDDKLFKYAKALRERPAFQTAASR